MNESANSEDHLDSDQLPAAAPASGHMLAQRIEAAAGVAQKAELLWSLPALERHAALGALDAATVAHVIEANPEENTALLGNIPAPKFSEIVNLGSAENGRRWLERAISSRMMAAQMLPALLSTRDLVPMLMSSSEYRSALSGLLNFRRAEELRSLLHPMEWKKNLDDFLLADAEELLRKAPLRERSLRGILQSLIDFFPELYLEVIRQSLEYAKYGEDHGEELADLLDAPFAMPEFLSEAAGAVGDDGKAQGDGTPVPPASAPAAPGLVPTAADPFLQLATSGLPVDRRDQIEAELRELLRREILNTGSFSEADLLRAAGRLLFQIRAGLSSLGAETPESATAVLMTRSFADVVAAGARIAERYRQRALQLAGVRDWMDRSQKLLLGAMNRVEPGIDPETQEPALYLSTRVGQAREDWQPTLLHEIDERLGEIQGWVALARAAFGAPARVQSILALTKTKTAVEAVRRTIIALCLYRRWEPELINPQEDLGEFRRRFADSLGRYDAAREVVMDALEATSQEAWGPGDGKERARALMLRVIDEMQSARRIKPARATATVPEGDLED